MDWHSDIPPLLLSVMCGFVIGLERELKKKPAGLRTNMIICIGATIFTLISIKIGTQFQDSITRIAANVVVGVGFLGGGAVIQERAGVHGLTTAATIWLVACIGMACGAKFYSLAIIGTIVSIIVLIGLAGVDKYLSARGLKKDE